MDGQQHQEQQESSAWKNQMAYDMLNATIRTQSIEIERLKGRIAEKPGFLAEQEKEMCQLRSAYRFLESDAKGLQSTLTIVEQCCGVLFLLVGKLVGNNAALKHFGIQKDSLENEDLLCNVILQLEGFEEVSFGLKREDVKDLNLPIVDVRVPLYSSEQNFQRLLNIYHGLVI